MPADGMTLAGLAGPRTLRPGLQWVGAALSLVASSTLAHAHASVEEVVADIKSRERYLEVVDREPPPFVLEDAAGRRVALSDFTGQVVVLNFLYARCRDVCPLHSALLAKVQRQLRDAGLQEGVQFISVATDTEEAQATVELLRQHGASHGLDPANWEFLYRGAAPAATTVQLAERYGLLFTPTPDGAQMHGVVTHVIDPDGRLRARFHGLRFAPENLVLHVAALLHGDHQATAPAAATGDAGTPATASETAETAWLTWVRTVVGLLGLAVALAAVYAWRRDRVRR